MELNDEEYQKYLVWMLEHQYKLDYETTTQQVKEIQDTLSKKLEFEEAKLFTAIDDVNALIKDHHQVSQQAVEFAVKKVLQHFPEHEGKNTRILTVAGHGDFMIDLNTGEFLGGKKYLYDDWVEGKLNEPVNPKSNKIVPTRLLVLIVFGVLILGFTVTSIVTICQSISTSWSTITSVEEYRFAKPGQQGYRPHNQN